MRLSIRLVLFLLIGLTLSSCKSRSSQMNEHETKSVVKNAVADSSISIRTNREIYHIHDTVKIIVNGYLVTTGGCAPMPQCGLLILNNGTWDTIQNVKNMVQMDCGMPAWKFENNEFYIYNKPLKNQNDEPLRIGTYRFSIIHGKDIHVIYSLPFRVE